MEKQSVLLNITEDAQNEALFMSKTFVNMVVKRRVYVNTLGVESFMHYLSDNGFEFDNLHNIHSITRVVEKADVADILAENIHIDVRVIFDENEIFVPKTHKKFGLTPDIYAVLKMGSVPEAFEFIGYFKSDVINEKDCNNDYYFVSKDELLVPETLGAYLNNAKYSHEKSLTESELLRGRELSILNADHDITDEEFKEYMGLLLSSRALRDSVSEFDNFETLSYDVVPILLNEEFSSEEEIEEGTEEDIEEEIEEGTEQLETVENPEVAEEDSEFGSIIGDTLKNAGTAIAGTAAAAGIASAAAAGSETINSAGATGKAIELAGNAGDVIEDIIGTDKKKEEPVPEITLDEINIDENMILDIEPSDIENIATEIPLDSELIESVEKKVSQTEDLQVVEPTETQDIFEDFEEFEKIAEPIEEIEEKSDIDVQPSDMLTEEEINLTETPEIVDVPDNSITPVGEDEIFKDTEYDELFDENNPQEPTYNYAEHEKVQNEEKIEQAVEDDGLFTDKVDEDDEFLVNFADFEKAVESENLPFENSISISDKDATVGEIPIDINNMQDDIPMPSEHLEDIYNESPDIVTEAPLNNSVMIGKVQASESTKKGILAGVGALVLLAGISFGAMKFIKPANQTANTSLPEPQPQTADAGSTQENQNTLNLDNNNVVNMENNNSASAPQVAKTTQQPAKKIGATSFMSIRKLSWEVPDYISYNAAFKQYFQSAGKSLKAALSSDLLLADEYAYSDQVRVSVLFDKMGTFKEAKILLSSGSAQIDKIVLQSVNQTLNILKAPQSVGNDESTTVILKIYF